MKYNFNKKDLLLSRQDYMYTPFYGKDFIDAYEKNRSNYIKKLQSKNISKKYIYLGYIINYIFKKDSNYKNNKELSCIAIDLKIHNINQLAKSEYCSTLKLNKRLLINTNKLLDSIIVNYIKNINCTVTNYYLEKIINKFEVSKKIYSTYSSDFKKIGRQNKIVTLYLKLSLLLSLRYIQTSDIRYLSTLLKLNDLISSTKLSLDNVFHDELLLIFTLEKIFVTKLKKSK